MKHIFQLNTIQTTFMTNGHLLYNTISLFLFVRLLPLCTALHCLLLMSGINQWLLPDTHKIRTMKKIYCVCFFCSLVQLSLLFIFTENSPKSTKRTKKKWLVDMKEPPSQMPPFCLIIALHLILLCLCSRYRYNVRDALIRS